MEKTAAERPAVVEKAQEKTEAKAEAKVDAKADSQASTPSPPTAKSRRAKSDVKSAESPADADQRRQAGRAARKGKDQGRTAVAHPARDIAPAPVVAAANPVAPVETAVAPDERRDANDLARAAIERLRVNGEGSPRAPEVARAPDAPKIADAPEGGCAEANARLRRRFGRCRRRSWSRPLQSPASPMVRLRRSEAALRGQC